MRSKSFQGPGRRRTCHFSPQGTEKWRHATSIGPLALNEILARDERYVRQPPLCRSKRHIVPASGAIAPVRTPRHSPVLTVRAVRAPADKRTRSSASVRVNTPSVALTQRTPNSAPRRCPGATPRPSPRRPTVPQWHRHESVARSGAPLIRHRIGGGPPSRRTGKHDAAGIAARDDNGDDARRREPLGLPHGIVPAGEHRRFVGIG